MGKTQPLIRFLASFFLALFVFSIVIVARPLGENKVYAYEGAKLDELAKAWMFLEYVRSIGFDSDYMGYGNLDAYANIKAGDSSECGWATVGRLISPGDGEVHAKYNSSCLTSGNSSVGGEIVDDNRFALFDPIVKTLVGPDGKQLTNGTDFVKALGYKLGSDGKYSGGSTDAAHLQAILDKTWPADLDKGNFGAGTAPAFVQYISATNTLQSACSPKAGNIYALKEAGTDGDHLQLVAPGDTKPDTYAVQAADDSADVEIGLGLAMREDPSGHISCGNVKKSLIESVNGKSRAAYYAIALATNTAGTASGALATGNATQNSDECAKLGNSSIRWLLCPIYDMAAKFTEGINGVLQNLLSYGANYMEGAGGSGLHASWSVFRGFALILLVIAGLVMVISQVLGFNFLDAYTIKKILPRILIAIIGITLSWEIIKFVVMFFDNLGHWIGEIILSPFKTGLASSGNLDQGNAAETITGMLFSTGALSAAALGTVAVMGIGGVMSLIVSMALAALVALIVLGIRTAIITLCIVIAPLAIAAYILPGTKKFWDFWQNTFTTALMMFPIVMAFIAAGQAASLMISTSGGNGWLAAIVRFAPYFLLPFAFKLAGGLMKTIFSIADDKNRGAFDRLKKYRGNKMASNFDKMKKGERFSNTNAFGRGFNTRTRAAANFKNGGFAFSQDKRIARRQSALGQSELRHAQEAMEKNEDFRAISNVDELLYAAKDQRSEQDVRAFLQKGNKHFAGYSGARLEESVARVMRAKGSMNDQTMKMAASMQLAATGTGYKTADDMMASIADATHGNDNLALDMMGRMRGISNQARRMDLGSAGFGTMMKEQLKATEAYRNSGGSVSAAKSAVNGAAIYDDAARSVDTNTLLRGNRNEGLINIAGSTAADINRLEKKRTLQGGLSAEEGQTLGRLIARRGNIQQTIGMYGASEHATGIVNDDLTSQTTGAAREAQLMDYQEQPIMTDPSGNPLLTLPDRNGIQRPIEGPSVQQRNGNHEVVSGNRKYRMQGRQGISPDDPNIQPPGP